MKRGAYAPSRVVMGAPANHSAATELDTVRRRITRSASRVASCILDLSHDSKTPTLHFRPMSMNNPPPTNPANSHAFSKTQINFQMLSGWQTASGPIPQGLNLSAQGWPSSSGLPWVTAINRRNPEGIESPMDGALFDPFRVVISWRSHPG